MEDGEGRDETGTQFPDWTAYCVCIWWWHRVRLVHRTHSESNPNQRDLKRVPHANCVVNMTRSSPDFQNLKQKGIPLLDHFAKKSWPESHGSRDSHKRIIYFRFTWSTPCNLWYRHKHIKIFQRAEKVSLNCTSLPSGTGGTWNKSVLSWTQRNKSLSLCGVYHW